VTLGSTALMFLVRRPIFLTLEDTVFRTIDLLPSSGVWETPTVLQNGVFWDVPLCGSRRNRRFGGTLRLLHQGDKNR
jgi:hypothetical protein